MNIDHTHPAYLSRHSVMSDNRFNGAYYYSQEITRNMIPNVTTARPWVTVNCRRAMDGAIVFVHNNLHPENYDFLREYRDNVLVCGLEETCEKVAHLGTAIYIPLSIDTEEVAAYRRDEKTKERAFAGRAVKAEGITIPHGADILTGLPRSAFLKRLAQYRSVYAVGRTAIEAKALGCSVLAYDPRFPDPERWQVLDNKDAARILQKKLDEIDENRQNSIKSEK